jgi:ABC-2 type transport system permease protein
MRSIATAIIRSSAFIGKELQEVFRQTRLILTLVLGPFLIMLLFGIGYRNQARALRTLFVIPQQNSPIAQQVRSYANSLGPQLIYEGITADQNSALQKLRQGQVDVVVVVPKNIDQTINNNQQVVFTLYHNEIDPFQASYVEYFGRAYLDEVNRRILEQEVAQGQKEAGNLQPQVESALQSAKNMRVALQRGDVAAAQSENQNFQSNLDGAALALAGGVGLLSNVSNPAESSTVGDSSAVGMMALLADINKNRSGLNNIQSGSDYSQEITKLQKIESDLTQIDSQLTTFRKIDPQVVVTPFTSVTKSIAGVSLTPTGFFAPAVIVLLLQHLGVTFAALSIVRERRSGAMELFRISPLSSIETIFGKYISYIFFGAVLAAIISATVVFALGIPMKGSWVSYALVLLVLLFTALGYGFFISLISQTDTQAVQYSMFLLLGSVFFSGFFLNLHYLWQPLHVVSWMLPATYGINLLQDIMLRGNPPNPLLFFGFLAIGIGLFLLDWLLLRRQMRHE